MVVVASPKAPHMEAVSVASDGSVSNNEPAKSIFADTAVQELDRSGWAAVEARAATNTGFAVNFHSSNQKSVATGDAIIAWAMRPVEYNVKVVAVNCDQDGQLCLDQDVFQTDTPRIKLYTPFEDALGEHPEFYPPDGFFEPSALAGWVRAFMHKKRDERNRRQALKMIRREDRFVFDVGDEYEKIACSIHAARNVAMVMSAKGSAEEARAQGLTLSDHPLQDLWGLGLDVDGKPPAQDSGNCGEVAAILRPVADGDKRGYAHAFQKLALRAFELMGHEKLRWQKGDPWSEMMIGALAPSLAGFKVLRLCVGLGERAPIEVWMHCLGNEGNQIKDEL